MGFLSLFLIILFISPFLSSINEENTEKTRKKNIKIKTKFFYSLKKEPIIEIDTSADKIYNDSIWYNYINTELSNGNVGMLGVIFDKLVKACKKDDRVFQNPSSINRLVDLVVRILEQSPDDSIYESVLCFLVQITSKDYSNIVGILIEKGLVSSIVKQISSTNSNMRFFSIRCLSNMASNSKEDQSFVLSAYPVDNLIADFKNDNCNKNYKEFIKLLRSYSLYSMHNDNFITIFDFVSNLLQSKNLCISKQLFRLLSSLINNEIILHLIQKDSNIMKEIDYYYELSNITCDSLEFLASFIFLCETPFVFNFQYIVNSLFHSNRRISMLSSICLHNAVLLGCDIVEMIITEEVFKRYLDLINDSVGTQKYELVMLFSALLMNMNYNQLSFIYSCNVIPIFKDSLFTEDPVIIKSSLSSLYKLFSFRNITKSNLQKEMEEQEIIPVLVELLSSDNSEIRHYSNSFIEYVKVETKKETRTPFTLKLSYMDE